MLENAPDSIKRLKPLGHPGHYVEMQLYSKSSGCISVTLSIETLSPSANSRPPCINRCTRTSTPNACDTSRLTVATESARLTNTDSRLPLIIRIGSSKSPGKEDRSS
eukprot:113682_1